MGRDAGGFDAVAARRKVIFSEMYLGLDNGELIVEVTQMVVLSVVMLDFGGGIPIVEVGAGVAECVEGRGWADEESVEPYGKGLSDI